MTPNNSPEAASSCHHARAFTLVEILIVVVILAILAAIVVPRFSDASAEARGSTTLSQLRHVRGQISRYKFDHNDLLPDLVTNQWQQLTQTTDEFGVVDDEGKHGPYLLSAPVNPFTNSTVVAATEEAGNGWVYDITTGHITAVGFDERTLTYTEPE